MKTHSRRCSAESSSVGPPPRLQYQKPIGITLRRERSLCHHWTMKRAANIACPPKPTPSHSFSEIIERILHRSLKRDKQIQAAQSPVRPLPLLQLAQGGRISRIQLPQTSCPCAGDCVK